VRGGVITSNNKRRGKNTRRLNAAERHAKRAYDAARREARRGLVYGPYLTADARCSIETATGGACTKLRRKYAQPRPHTWQRPRGKVREFSRRSRTRLQQTLCAMPIVHVSRGILFITLTYPNDWPGQWATWKRQLDTWLKRLRRRLPAAAGVWKLEPQVRGAPHFHLLLVGAPFLAKAWLSETWYDVVGSHDPKHLAAGTNVQLANSHRGVLAYAAKYTAKHQELPASWRDGVGRWWGVFNRRGLAIEWRRLPLWDTEYYALLRQLRQLVAARQRAAARAPPRAASAGWWAVVTDLQANRLVRGQRGLTQQWRYLSPARVIPNRGRAGNSGCQANPGPIVRSGAECATAAARQP